MPHIDEAMRRSLRRGVGEVLVDRVLRRQSIIDKAGDVKDTFSSWDNCMAKTYCKWPVIAGIAIGGLMIFSVVWCIIRCCCCGMSCCCSCFSFLKCCDCCGGLCDGKKNKPHKHLDDPYSHHAVSSGFRPSPAMPSVGGYGAKSEPPQYAQFEVGPNGHAVAPKPLSEDALPPMPSWDTATKKHVEEKGEAVELGELDPTTGQKVPLMSGAAAGASNPVSPAGFEPNNSTPLAARDGQGGANGYVGVAAGDPYNQNQSSLTNNPNGYGPQSNGVSRGYGSPPPQDQYGQNTNFINAAVPGYNRPMQRQNTGDRPYNDMGNRGYPPQQQRQYTGNSSRTYDQYSDQSSNFGGQQPRGPSRGPGRMASPPNNNSGFDFNGNENQSYNRPGYSQQTSYSTDRRQNGPNDYNDNSHSNQGYGQRSPPPLEPQYSGYSDYQQQPTSQSHRRDPTALRPGGGRDRRQPQGWDPVNNNNY